MSTLHEARSDRYADITHTEVFADLVDDLLQLAANHPARTIRNIAIRALCSFAMLKGRPESADALDGPVVCKIISHAMSILGPAQGQA